TFSTYPNPATSQLTVAIPKIYIDSTSEASITIFNNLGQIIDRLQITSETTIINTAAYNRGLYFLMLHHGKHFLGINKVVID
ncbi:MAG: T9SS type A sorting domain-containing protein, partial [Altibacter sp.]|nr:T9SS type A sorting domain-containing protein [Altibacter sp.]